LTEGDTVYFDYYTDNLSLADSLLSSGCYINNNNYPLAGFYSVYPDSMAIYGNLYRGWGQFSYYGNTSTIDESALIIDQTLVDTTEWTNFPFSDIENNMYTWDFDTLDSNFMNNFNNTVDTNFIQNIYNIPILPMQANRENDKWVDMFNIAYCDYTTMGYQSLLHSIITSFINMDTTVFQSDDTDIPVFGSVIPGGNDSIYNTKVINKYSEQYTNSFSVNVGLLPFSGLTKSRSRTQSFGFSDFMDFNGDRYPDIINKGKIQYTNSHGGLSNYIYNTGHAYLTKSISESKGNSYGVKSLSMVNTKPNGGAKSKLDNINGNFGIGHVDGSSDIQYMYVDINGDGLPDRINVDEGNHSIELNLGYSFINNIPPNIFNLNIDTLSKNKSNSISLNLGVNIGNYSISSGIGGGLNISTDKYSLMDINNDGFVDLCYLDNNGTLKVYYNNGSSFQTAQSITINNIPMISKNKSYNIGANGSFTVGIPLFSTLFFTIKLTGTPYADLSFNFSTDRARLTDINGDGFIDYLYVDDSGNTYVKYGIPRKTNILKQVKTPTGAKYYCDYELKYPDRENPNSKWVMASLKVYDGFVGDGVDTTYYKFKYENPKYHRMERESFGYETVTTEQYNNNNHIYRVVIEKYHNQDFLFKGLKKYDVTYNAMGQKYVETEYKWDKKEITTGRVVIDSLITCFGPYYPAISMETKRYYEGQSTASIITKKLYEHGKYGNVIQYVNEYNSSYTEDNLKANIHYTYDLNNHLLEMADEIKVYDYADNMLQRREASYNNYGKMTQMRVFNNNDIAYTDLQYDNYGNVNQILYPQDVNGDRLSFTYEYDHILNTYPIRITDFWNNSMYTDYDYRLGLPTKVQDPSGNFVLYTYYEDGKLNTVTAPNEINNGAPYTIKCDYWTNHHAYLYNNTGLWAQTLHYDPLNDGNEFETVTISDGLGRAIQVKKKSTIYGVDSVIVSGKIIFDAFGRKITEYQPETEAYSGTINHNYSNLSWQNPTTYSYDIMDRPIQQNNPDGTNIIYSYNFGQDNFGKTCFKTKIIDPNGNITEQYKDARNLQTTVVAPMNTITKFIYTPLGQIKTSIDPEGNATHYNYDMLGRLIEREHPDAGITQYQY
ncbi:MAG: toxin TcdB middle/N-terminal domain-containing protein, partial [Bacteroidales bacterium]